MGIASRYYSKRYDLWFRAEGFIQHKVIAEFGTIYDHMYLFFTEVVGLEKDIAISLVDEYRVEELLCSVNNRVEGNS